MRFQQIKELLHYLEQVHHQLGLCYGRLTSQVGSERSRMLLVHLQGREDAATAHLHEYASQLGEAVRETWLNQSFSEDMLPAITRFRAARLGPDPGYRHSGVLLGRVAGGRAGPSGPGVPDTGHGRLARQSGRAGADPPDPTGAWGTSTR